MNYICHLGECDDFCKTSKTVFLDKNKIFKPALRSSFTSKLIDITPSKHWTKYYVVDSPIGGTPCKRLCDANIDKFSKYLTRTLGNLYVKMLACMEDKPCSYYEIYAKLLKSRGKPFGNDIESFKNLELNGLAEIDHLGKYKRKYFRLTPLGKAVVENAKKNDVAYRVLRHVMKFKDCCDAHLINVSLNPDTMDDLTPKSFIDMLDAILNEDSPLHEVGSYAYWCDKLIDALKKNGMFFEMFNCPEIYEYLDKYSSNPNVQNFKKVFDKISKKYAKKAA